MSQVISIETGEELGIQTKPAVVLRQQGAPLLSIVTRTQGKRLETLQDIFVCLQAQTCQDFEHLIVLHNGADRAAAVAGLVAMQPPSLREKVKVLPVDGGTRTTPLNFGFGGAVGAYVSMLDDDDVVFDHWVETFAHLAEAAPGRVLRAICLTQDFDEIALPGGSKAPRAVGPISRRYPTKFDLAEHLYDNYSPLHSLAYPRVLRAEGLCFDEGLTTLEDYDFLLRAALRVGVASAEEVTGLYRIWRVGESSTSLHREAEWQENKGKIWQKLETLMPAGLAKQVRAEMKTNPPRHLVVDANLVQLRHELDALYRSASWRLSAPLRFLFRLAGRPAFVPPKIDELDHGQLARQIASVKESLSWRLMAPLRALRHMKRGPDVRS